ncbi:tRNA (guanosine(46)-N7)-methyltransferase TrmB [soil metagenome]
MSTHERAAASLRGGARTTHRRGRMSAAKRTVLTELGPRWMLDPGEVATPGALAQRFARDVPRLLDIGGGNGQAARDWAQEHGDHDVVAVELHRPGIARLVADLEGGGPPNVRVVEADVTRLLDDAGPGSFAAVRVLFPDPWPKRRHVGRRLVEPGFVRRVADILPAGGWVHLATDWDEYAAQMRWVLATEPRLDPVVEASDVGGTSWRTTRPSRPVTAYEQRGLDAGRTITDLVALRRAG